MLKDKKQIKKWFCISALILMLIITVIAGYNQDGVMGVFVYILAIFGLPIARLDWEKRNNVQSGDQG